jgi:beta-galactosidase
MRFVRAFSGTTIAVVSIVAASLAALSAPHCLAQAAVPIRIDASQPYLDPGPASYEEDSPTSPSGETIEVNDRYFVRDGKPWLPVMGEFHFSRYPREEWEEEILKMKAAGVNIVATYLIWIHHEEVQGQFDWSGRRDLRAFVLLCAKHGMYVVVRIGPWIHGEVRNGGFPDWVVRSGPTRVNGLLYLGFVRAWYGQIAQQLKGLLWGDGGPIIGVQLENEYAQRGPGAGDEHILELKKIARASGLNVPFYFVTGWDNAVVPEPEVLPVYGGYPDAPWDASRKKLPPSEVYAFRFDTRVSGDLGTMNARPASSTETPHHATPFLTAEIGGAVQDAYHRRPVIEADAIAAMFPVMLGSGVNLYGTYMFQGGENPHGKLTTLQESQATGYPNDLPVESYDFQAPLGEFGQERMSLRKMKVFQYFINSFGSELAPMTVHAPFTLPKNAADFSVVRASVRTRGDAGFLFCNNYVRAYPMPARHGTQFEIKVPGGMLKLPRHPVDIPSGAYFIWPFNLRFGGATLRYSTAQPITRLHDRSGSTTVFFEAIPGIAPEFAFDAATEHVSHLSSGNDDKGAGVEYITGIYPGVDSAIVLRSSSGERIRIVVLSQEEAEEAWRVWLNGSDHLLLTSQEFFSAQDGQDTRITLRSYGDPHFALTVTPPAVSLNGSVALTRLSATPSAISFKAVVGSRGIDPALKMIQAPQPVPPVAIGPSLGWRPNGVAEAPSDAAFDRAAKWSIEIPANALQGLSNLFLDVQYAGDVARFTSGHVLLDDNFFNGQPWQIGLKRFLDPMKTTRFDLEILPLRADSPIYLQDWPKFPAGGQVGELKSLRLIPQYELTITSQ